MTSQNCATLNKKKLSGIAATVKILCAELFCLRASAFYLFFRERKPNNVKHPKTGYFTHEVSDSLSFVSNIILLLLFSNTYLSSDIHKWCCSVCQYTVMALHKCLDLLDFDGGNMSVS